MVVVEQHVLAGRGHAERRRGAARVLDVVRAAGRVGEPLRRRREAPAARAAVRAPDLALVPAAEHEQPVRVVANHDQVVLLQEPRRVIRRLHPDGALGEQLPGGVVRVRHGEQVRAGEEPWLGGARLARRHLALCTSRNR
jgi:hypothetical protein